MKRLTKEEIEALRGKKLKDIDPEILEECVLQTAFAYFYKKRACQYNMTTTLTLQARRGAFLDTENYSPEMAAMDQPYYSQCRSYVSDVYYDAFGWKLPNFEDGWFDVFARQEKEFLDMIHLQYSHNRKEITGLPESETMTLRLPFLTKMNEELRPGDILFALKQIPRDGGHVILYVGDYFGDGEKYCLHSWPEGGGSLRTNDEINHWEPHGGIILERFQDLALRVDSPLTGPRPNWSFAAQKPNTDDNMNEVWLIRPFKNKEYMENTTLSEKMLSRLRFPNLCVDKNYGDFYASSFVMPEEEIPVTVTVRSCNGYDYENVEVTEVVPEGTELVRTSLSSDCVVEEKDGKTYLHWNVSVSGKKKESVKTSKLYWRLTMEEAGKTECHYTLRVKSPVGTTLYFPEGKCAEIPTRDFRLRVGRERLSKENIADLAWIAHATPMFLRKKFMDLDFVNLFYREVLGKEIGLPKTVEELLPVLFEKTHPENTPELEMFTLREDGDLAARKILNKRVFKNVFGYYVYLPEHLKNTYHALDILPEYYAPGDVFIIYEEKNPVNAPLDPSKIKIYIYLGNGIVMLHQMAETVAESTKRTTFTTTVERALLKPLFICLRPVQDI